MLVLAVSRLAPGARGRDVDVVPPVAAARRCVGVAGRRRSASIVTGDLQGQLMTEQQPMKMAAAEALCDTDRSAASFSLFTLGSLDAVARRARRRRRRCPALLSFMATDTFDGTVEGINDLQRSYEQQLRARRLRPGRPA